MFLPAEPVAPVAGTRYRLQVEGSANLESWGAPADLAASEDPDAPLKLALNEGEAGFYRLSYELQDQGGADGPELFGYNRVFGQELRKIGYPTPGEFAARYTPTNAYLPQIGFDPTSARYWTEFNTDPAVFNAGLPANSPDRRLYDFRLNAAEFGKFKTNGFVVSERLGSYSFADVYYKIFTDDLPVFISADSVLHAWHWSYQAMLSELEETQLTQVLEQLLNEMAGDIPAIAAEVGDGPLRDSVLDADYFLAVARTLLSGNRIPTQLSQEDRLSKTLDAISRLQYDNSFPLWGTPRRFDFSQFRVRGHYERNRELGRYFQAFLWTSLADLRVAGMDANLREAGTAVVLDELIRRNHKIDLWAALDELLELYVGRTDALSFREMGNLRAASGLIDFTTANRPEGIARFQADLLAGTFGVQNYAGAAYPTPLGPAQTQLPRVFSAFGRRFILDGWATAQVTFDRIRWNEDLPDGKTFHGKVVRRIPIGLDVAFGVLGNTQVAPEIAAYILGGSDPIRDGLPYQHNLAAVKATLDQQEPTAWEESIYSRWLFALRNLSAPTTDPRFPQAMRTRAWAMKTVNTQLASWTQLRHDTVLYAAQPYSGIILCEYPAGYIEPRVEFWEAMRRMAQATAETMDKFNVSGWQVLGNTQSGQHVLVSLSERKAARVAHCLNFAAQMAHLRDLATRELAGLPFSDADILFIRSTMNSQIDPYRGKTFDGWYPGLFYKDYGQSEPGSADINASDRRDPLVTDVHSAPPDEPGFPGAVLHEGVGDVDLLLISVDNGTDRMVYAGPTLSHYEFTVPGLNRLTDGEWSAQKKPSRPEWTRDYLEAP